MNRTTKITANWIIGIGIFLAFGIAGSIDRNEEINGSISQELYHKIESDLGGYASEREIISKYEEDKAKYDSLGI